MNIIVLERLSHLPKDQTFTAICPVTDVKDAEQIARQRQINLAYYWPRTKTIFIPKGQRHDDFSHHD